MASSPDEAVYTTAEGLEEKAKLQRHFRRLDMLLFTVCALVGLDTLGQVSGFGAATFSWLVILAIFFLFPYALHHGRARNDLHPGGRPVRVDEDGVGSAWGGVGAVLYWVTNPLWVGGSLAFIATAAWSTYIHPIGDGSVGDYAFKTVFIWISIIVAIISLKRGKWIPNLGAIVRIGVLAFFSLTVVIYAIEHGVHGYAAGKFTRSSSPRSSASCRCCCSTTSASSCRTAPPRRWRTRRRTSRAVIQGGAISTLAYCIPVFGILAVLPASKITGIGGFLDAVNTTFGVYGSAGHFLTQVMAVGFIFALVTSGSVWMMGSDRIQAVAAYDGAFFPWFGKFNARLGTPVRVNVLSGVASTLFMIAAVNLSSGSNASTSSWCSTWPRRRPSSPTC